MKFSPFHVLLGVVVMGASCCSAETAVKLEPPADLHTAILRQAAAEKASAAEFRGRFEAVRKWYGAQLDAVEKELTRRGDRDGVLMIKTERERMDHALTPEELKTMPPSLAGARTKYDYGLVQAAEAQKVGEITALREYAATLDALEKRLAQRGDADGALRVRGEALTVSTRLTEFAQQLAHKPTPSGILSTFAAGQPPQMTFYLCGSDIITVYVNSKKVISGVTRDKSSKVRVSLREGDVIAVMNEGRWDHQSFLLSCISPHGKFLFETSKEWMAYAPADESRWWIAKGATKQQPVVVASDGRPQVDTVKTAMKDTPLNHGAQPIRSNLLGLGKNGQTTYVFYTITRGDLVAKADPEGAGK